MTDRREALENHAGELDNERSELDVDLDEIRPSSAEEEGDTEAVLEGATVDTRPDGPERQDEAELALAQPFHSVRADEPGPRGCWAISKTTGEPCGAARRHGEDFCNAHSGIGVASDPRAYMPKAQEAQKRNRAIRAQMRLQLGNIRPTGPRAALQAMAMVESKRLARTALNGALSPDVPEAKAGALALAIIREADPPAQATLELRTDLTPEDVDRLSYSELPALAKQADIEIPEGLPTPHAPS